MGAQPEEDASGVRPVRVCVSSPQVRARCGDRFVEVYMKIPLSVCEQRDPKGLYKAARAGKIKGARARRRPTPRPFCLSKVSSRPSARLVIPTTSPPL